MNSKELMQESLQEAKEVYKNVFDKIIMFNYDNNLVVDIAKCIYVSKTVEKSRKERFKPYEQFSE